jgi:signal transduction histidine kinase/putative methionine-R-sulfoxide reductase with GAF domain
LLKAARQSIEDLSLLAGRLTIEGWKKYLTPQRRDLSVESGGISSTDADEVIENAFEKREVVVTESEDRASLAAPIVLRGQVIGALALEKDQGEGWSEDDRVLAQEVADHLALAADNARLADQVNRERERSSFLFSVSQELSATLDLPKTIRSLLNFAPRLGADHAFLIMVEGSAKDLYRYYSTIPGLDHLTEQEEKELIESLMTKGVERWVMENRRAALIKDTTTDERWHRREIKGRTPIRSAVAIPLYMPSGTVAGVLGYVHTFPDRFSEEQLPLLDSLAVQAYISLQNAQLYSQVRIQQRNANTLAVSTQKMSRTLNEEDLWQTLANSLFNAFQPNGVAIFKFDATAETLTPILTTIAPDDPDEWPVVDKSFPAIKRLDLAEVMSSRSARITIIRHEPPDQVRASIALPFIFGENLEGVVEVVHTGPAHGINQDDLTLFQSLLASTSYALQTARLYEQLSQTAERLREVDRLKSQFLANMSHELRTPLNSIIGFSRVIMKGIDGPVNDLQVQDLAAINNSGQHLLGMINDILDHAKIEAGKMELAFEKMDLSEIIKSVMSTTGGLIKDKPVRLVPDIQTGLPPVYVDGIRVRQVLINLLSNAAKFTEQGTITIRAALQESGTRSMVKVSVRDTGQGIAQEDLSKLFQAFTQVDGSATRRTDGTGLGLAISRNLVELHGGAIWVESTLGEGATFFFTLPVYQPEPALPQVQPEDNRRLILAIDDDARVIDLYRRYAEPHGYAVHGVTNNMQAAESAQLLKPFVILLDVLMQERNGWQVLQELKQNEATKNFPVIICSILNEREKALSMGAADCLINSPYAAS